MSSMEIDENQRYLSRLLLDVLALRSPEDINALSKYSITALKVATMSWILTTDSQKVSFSTRFDFVKQRNPYDTQALPSLTA